MGKNSTVVKTNGELNCVFRLCFRGDFLIWDPKGKSIWLYLDL